MARLSTHVLDTARGVPAGGVAIELHQLIDGQRRYVNSVTTNSEGRTDQPLLSDDTIDPGIYELTFFAGDYHRALGLTLSTPPFLDQIVIRVGLADPQGNYHVPLLLSPYGYSTYRGS